MNQLKELLFKATVIALLAAALNLAFQSGTPTKEDYNLDSSSYLTEQNIVFFPFNEKTTSSVSWKVCALQLFSFPEFKKQSSTLTGNTLVIELFQRQGFHFFKEYPFIVFVRKLRI